MREPRESRSITERAEEAAAAGNYASAEELLREAALLQETVLGPLHPDLADTLNNLGVVCEITGKPADAEHYFRRALTIATTVLEPDHPFVATSRRNLHDFCEARRKQVELPSFSPAAAAKLKAQATSWVDARSESRVQAKPKHLQPPARKRFVGRLVVGTGAMLVVIFVAGRPWLGSTERAESSSAIAIGSARHIPATPHAPSPVEPISAPTETPKTTQDDGANAGRITAASTAERPTVVRAQLCAELDKWNCDPPDRPVPQGPLFFYTQVKSATATTVRHRWYQDDQLQHSVEFRVQPSLSVGYRTYSRNTINTKSVGRWRVELRTEDDVLLHEERFSVTDD